MTEKLEVKCLWGFIADNEEGEGLCGFRTEDGQWMPMIAADEKRVDSLRPIAQAIAQATQKTIKLCRFSVRSDLEQFS